MPDKTNLMIVDGFNLAFRWKHAKKRNFAAEYLSTIMSFANSYTSAKVVVLSDGGADYRKELYPDYKSDRKSMRESQTEEEAKQFELFMEDWKDAFSLCGTQYITIQYKGVEADDIAACLATDKQILNKFEHIWMLSSDKDWDLLINEKVSKFSYRTRKETTIANWQEHYNYTPEEHISVKVLQGDKSDSIPGVEGIGEKRATSLVQEYGSSYDIYASLPIQDNKKYIQNLNKFGEQLLLNYELMDLPTYCWDNLMEYQDDLKERIGEILQ